MYIYRGHFYFTVNFQAPVTLFFYNTKGLSWREKHAKRNRQRRMLQFYCLLTPPLIDVWHVNVLNMMPLHGIWVWNEVSAHARSSSRGHCASEYECVCVCVSESVYVCMCVCKKEDSCQPVLCTSLSLVGPRGDRLQSSHSRPSQLSDKNQLNFKGL